MDKAPTTQLEEAEADESGAAEGRSQPYDFDPYPYAVETAQHAVVCNHGQWAWAWLVKGAGSRALPIAH